MLQAGSSRVRDPMMRIVLSIYVNLPATVGPGVYLASKQQINNYTKNPNKKLNITKIKERKNKILIYSN
jgi:hypothetical protein